MKLIEFMSTSLYSDTICATIETLRNAVIDGPPLHAIMALYTVSCLTILPLTWYRTGNSFNIGYGLSVASMSLVLSYSFTHIFNQGNTTLSFRNPPSILVLIALVYGLRLAAYTLIRKINVKEMRDKFKKINTTPFLQSTVMALGLSLLYTFMVTPALFALRNPLKEGSALYIIQWVFTCISALGMILESVADQHKYEVKRKRKEKIEGEFVGPTTWSYKLCRHPNYLGEILFWFGLYGAGCVSFGTSITGWICGSLGFCAILFIMFGSTNSLEKKQLKNYGNDRAYIEWKENVRFALIPFFV
jgi:steroid 5-alpha reductase family enzyme